MINPHKCLLIEIKVYVNKLICVILKQKIWKINSFYLSGILTKTIFGFEPARLFKCDVLELKDQLFKSCTIINLINLIL